uniref:Cyclin N-terminal domain-containing protein n=1 Tax=Caenorhabditis tropicalis TaxID=1561998 RepID=A0A1I7TPP0_9PELO
MSSSNKLIAEMNGTRYGSMIHPWLTKKDFMINRTPSRRDGMSYEEEMRRRQTGGLFIYEIMLTLSHGKGEHGMSGVAITLLHRFFNVHSLRHIDVRDVAAACVFLAGKNEDSPKKLKYVVNQLWQMKFPHMKQFPSEQVFIDQCNVVTFLEEMVLKTIAFDINIDLPHQAVLKLMRDIEKGRNVYKEMVKTAYYMASDVLLITDWSVRYSCAAIAVACINIAAFFHNINMDDIVPLEMAERWYKLQDTTMTRGDVNSMTDEFIDLFSRNPHLHIGSLKKIDQYGKVKIQGASPPPQVSSSTLAPSGSSSSNLKKIDLEAYKGRQKTASTGSNDPTPSTSSRPSFLPDVKNQRVVEEGLMMEQRRHAEYQRQQQQQQYRSSQPAPSSTGSYRSTGSSGSSSSSRHHQNLKRPIQPESHNSKKPRPSDYSIAFRAQTSTTHSTTTTDGYFCETTRTTTTTSEISEYAREFSQVAPPPPPPQLTAPPAPPPIPSLMSLPVSEPESAYKRMFMKQQPDRFVSSRRPSLKTALASRSSEYRAHPQQPLPPQQQNLMISSTQQISPPDESSPPNSTATMLLPPPPPPPILPPLHHHHHRGDEIEEGELV